MDRIQEILIALRTYYRGLTPQRRVSLTASLFVSLAVTAGLWGWATYDPMVPLFDQPLDSKTTAEIIEQLKLEEIPYELERGTDRLLVPDSSRDQVALSLRGSSLFASQGTGLEILEENKFGSTRFVEHVRWVRGLQGEIERQINGFGQVMASKVLLSIPEQTLFVEDQEDPSASVYVELKSGASLSAEEGARMASLVAAAVPRLRPTRVEILDSDMRIIHAAASDDDEIGIGGKLADLQQHYERYYQGKIESLLERILGPGNVVARISVELDNHERSIDRRELDGDRAVTISSRTRESTSSGSNAQEGVPGTTANLPELAVAAGGSTSNETAEADEVANVDVPETRTLMASLPGGVLSVNAAVIVNGSYKAAVVDAGEAADEAAQEETPPTYEPRTEEELADYRQIVARALGIPIANVSVINQPFAKIELTKAPPAVSAFKQAFDWVHIVKYSIALGALLLTFVMVVRPTMRKVTEAATSQELALAASGAVPGVAGGAAVAGLVDGEGGAADPTGAPSEEALAEWLDTVSSGARHVTRDEVNQLVSADLAHTVVTLQAWIHEEA